MHVRSAGCMCTYCDSEEKLSRRRWSRRTSRTRQDKARAWLHMIDIPQCCHCWGRLSGRLKSNSKKSIETLSNFTKRRKEETQSIIQTLNPAIICSSEVPSRRHETLQLQLQHAAANPQSQSVSQSIDQRDWNKSYKRTQ